MIKLIALHPGDQGYDDDRPLEDILDEINDIVNLVSSEIGYVNHRLIQEDLNTLLQRYGDNSEQKQDD